jgi:hypothetical protein
VLFPRKIGCRSSLMRNASDNHNKSAQAMASALRNYLGLALLLAALLAGPSTTAAADEDDGRTYYEVLGLDKSCGEREIKKVTIIKSICSVLKASSSARQRQPTNNRRHYNLPSPHPPLPSPFFPLMFSSPLHRRTGSSPCGGIPTRTKTTSRRRRSTSTRSQRRTRWGCVTVQVECS